MFDLKAGYEVLRPLDSVLRCRTVKGVLARRGTETSAVGVFPLTKALLMLM